MPSSGAGCLPAPSSGGEDRFADSLEGELAVVRRVDADGVAVAEVALQQPQRERVLDEPLDRPLQRPGAVSRIPAGVGERLLRGVGQLERDPPIGEIGRASCRERV